MRLAVRTTQVIFRQRYFRLAHVFRALHILPLEITIRQIQHCAEMPLSVALMRQPLLHCIRGIFYAFPEVFERDYHSCYVIESPTGDRSFQYKLNALPTERMH